MSWQYTPYSLLLGAAAAASLAIAVWASRARDKRGAPAFVALLGGLALWAGSDAAQLASTTLSGKLLFRTLGYVGHNLVPVLMLVFALSYTGRKRWLTRGAVAALALEPLFVAFVLTPTNALGWHGLIWSSVSVRTVDGVALLARTFGPWYWLNTAYNYVLVLAALSLFARLFHEGSEQARKQAAALLVGSIPPFVANLVWIAGATRIDYTPVAFTLTGAVFAVGLLRYGLLDLVPIARDAVLDEMADPYLVLDAEGRILDHNQPAAAVLAARGEILGKSVTAVLPEFDGDLSGRKEVTVETAEGERHFEVWQSTLGIGGRLLFMRDITERRSVERRYHALIENVSDLIAVLNTDGEFTYLSPACERILGYESATLVGTSAFDIVHPEDRDRVHEKFRRQITKGEARMAQEYRVKRADGTWIWIESRGSYLLDDPDVGGYVVNARDVTERKQRERALRRQNERLESFASVAAHDLRNPLNIIGGHLGLARETGEDRHFEAIERSTQRMETLVDDLLLLARQGKIVDETESVVLRAVAREAWANVETDEATVRFETDQQTLFADRSRFCSLLENLFRNSVEHGGSAVTVRVETTPTGFFVEDDGAGIPDEAREEIFDRGFSTESNGTGLGLPIIRSVATAHGWEVSLADAPGERTRFAVTGVEWLSESDGDEKADE